MSIDRMDAANEEVNMARGYLGVPNWVLDPVTDEIRAMKEPNHNPTNETDKTNDGIAPFYTSGAASSKIPRFDLIPYFALLAMANRFELGLIKYKEKAWNARSSNQTPLLDRDWVRHRAIHVINHALRYIAKMDGILVDCDGDDDAGAIMWGGACLFEARRYEEIHNKIKMGIEENNKK